MLNRSTPAYKGHTVEPLVYLYIEPKVGKLPRVRRYRAAVHVTDLATQEIQVAKLPMDYEFFGDARRAAEARGREMIDHPEQAEAPAEIAAEAAHENTQAPEAPADPA